MHKKIIIILNIICISIFIFNYSSFANTDTKMIAEKTPMQEYVEKTSPGWNLGNTFDTVAEWSSDRDSWETCWGNPPVSMQQIKAVKDMGFNSLRLPVSWFYHTGPAPDYKISPVWMAKVKQVVDWCMEEDLYVMLNSHHDSTPCTNYINDPTLLDKYTKIWEQISNEFKDYDNRLMFESINEPGFYDETGENQANETTFKILDKFNKTFVKTVRQSGGNNSSRPLVLPTFWTSDENEPCNQLRLTIDEINDKNIIATIHHYGPWFFHRNGCGYYKCDDWVREYIDDGMNRLYDHFTKDGIPVIIGEFGGVGDVHPDQAYRFIQYLSSKSREQGISMMLWDAGGSLDRRTLKWNEEQFVHYIIRGAKENSSTAETDTIFIEKGVDVTDKQLVLELNGNDLLSISDGEKELIKGEDYVLSDNILTFKKNYLESLAKGETGTKAKLSLKFSKGLNWTEYINYISKPEFLNSTGNASNGLLIPCKFNGDKLAMTKAVYSSGGYAGPYGWTSGKPYGTVYADYDNQKIVITKEFFDEVEQNKEVVLTFVFWSGREVSYKILKTDASVTGKYGDLGIEDLTPDFRENPGKPFDVCVKVTSDNVDSEVVLVAAIYYNNDELIHVITDKGNIKKGESLLLNARINILMDKNYTLKYFVLNGLENLKPLCPVLGE